MLLLLQTQGITNLSDSTTLIPSAPLYPAQEGEVLGGQSGLALPGSLHVLFGVLSLAIEHRPHTSNYIENC